MALRIRRGTNAERLAMSSNTTDAGELLWTTDTQKLFVGLGNGLSGAAQMVNVGKMLAGDGLAWDETTQTLKFGGVNYTTDDVAEGIMAGRQYFTDARAQSAVALALAAGTHQHISFVYDDQAESISATVTLDGTGILSVEADTSPSLGGNLDINNNDITGTGNIDITGSINNGTVLLDGSSLISSENIPATADRTDAPLYIGNNTTPNTLWVTSDNNFGVFRGLTDGTNNAGITFKISRGTLPTPTAIASGDGIVFFDGQAYNGSDYTFVGAFGLTTDPAWNGIPGTNGELPGQFGAIVLDEFGTQHLLQFNSNGVLDVPKLSVGNGSASSPSIFFTTDGGQDTGFSHPGDGIIVVSANANEVARFDSGGFRSLGFIKVAEVNGSLPNPPEAGMIVLDNGIFKGYTGSTWVNLN